MSPINETHILNCAFILLQSHSRLHLHIAYSELHTVTVKSVCTLCWTGIYLCVSIYLLFCVCAEVSTLTVLWSCSIAADVYVPCYKELILDLWFQTNTFWLKFVLAVIWWYSMRWMVCKKWMWNVKTWTLMSLADDVRRLKGGLKFFEKLAKCKETAVVQHLKSNNLIWNLPADLPSQFPLD